MLHKLNLEGFGGGTKWCGPSAVSILTGRPLAHTTAMLAYAEDIPYDEVGGVWREDAVLMLHTLGYRCVPIDVVSRFSDTECGPTLKRFWEERRMDEVVNPLLIEIHGHLLTSHYGFAADNWTGGPVPLAQFPKQRRLVKWAGIVTKM